MVLLVLLAILAGLWALRNLDTSLVKTRLRNLVRSQAGLELDYRSARADLFSGLVLRDVTIDSPPAFRDVAPTLVRIDALALGWSLFGSGPTLRKLTATDVELTIVVDEHWHTSLDTLGNKPAEKPAAPPTPGARLGAIVRGLPDFDRLGFTHVTLTLLQTRAQQVVARTQVRGIDFVAETTRRGQARRVALAVGNKLLPLALVVAHQAGAEQGEARARLWLDLGIDDAAADVHGELTLERQTLSKEWPKKGTLLAIDAQARAHGDDLTVALARLDAVGEMIVMKGAVALGPARARVETAAGTLDLTRLARLVPERLPLTLREGHVKYDVAGLEVMPAPRLDGGGHLELDGHAADLRLGRGDETLELDGARLALKGRPLADGGVALAADVPAALLRLQSGKQRLELVRAETAFKAALSPSAPWAIELRTRFDALSTVAIAGAFKATRGSIETRLAELRVDGAQPARSSGAIAVAVSLDGLDAQARDLGVHASGLKLTSRGRVSDGAPESLELDAPIARLAVTSARELGLPPGPARLTARAAHVQLDRAAPALTSGDGRVTVDAGGVALALDVKKQRESADFKLAVEAPRCALLTALAPPSLRLPGARMSLTLASAGRVDGLGGAPRLRQHATAHVTLPAVTIAEQTLAAATLDLVVDSDGGERRQQATLTMAPRALALEDERLGDGKLTAKLAWDLSRPSVELALDGEGAALPSGHLTVAAAWDRAARAIDYRVDGELAHLAALSPFLPATLTDEHWIDLSDVRTKIVSKGKLGGVVTRFDARGLPEWAPHPLTTMHGTDDLLLSVGWFHYVDAAGVELSVPSLDLTAHLAAEGERRRASAELRVPRATLTARGHKLDIAGLHDVVDASVEGDPSVGAFEVTHKLELDRLDQDLVALYPVGGVTQTTHGRRGNDGGFVVDKFEFKNDAAGTELTLRGGLLLARAVGKRAPGAAAPPVGFSSLTMSLGLTQRLDRLRGDPGRFKGGGAVSVEADVASGDLHRFHAAAAVHFQQASIELPKQRIAALGIDGTVPLVEDFDSHGGQTRIVPAEQANAYPQVRFADQHPFLSRPGALRIEHVTVADFTLDDAAGSVRIVRNQFAVDQLDAAVRGGRVAGQFLVDWRGPDSTAQLRLRLSGIQALHQGARERFDGNAALTVSLAQRTVDGRVEILRIGRHHLYDLLDEYDPHHKDAATNRVRTALNLGYPDRVHLLFDRGFANMSVSFGGLGKLVKVGDVHGIPTGPLVERYLGPLLALESP